MVFPEGLEIRKIQISSCKINPIFAIRSVALSNISSSILLVYVFIAEYLAILLSVLEPNKNSYVKSNNFEKLKSRMKTILNPIKSSKK